MCAQTSQPRHRRIKREARLQSAKTWIAKYPGKNLVRGYRKHFGVDWLCAVLELQMIGVRLDPQYVQQLKEEAANAQKRNQARKQLKKAKELQDFDPESDENFAYIVGHTSGGVPYGVTWEEMDQWSNENDFA